MPHGLRRLALALALASLALLALMPSPRRRVRGARFAGVARYYGGARCAVIIRVDDFVADRSLLDRIPDDLRNPREWYENYQMIFIDFMLAEHPGVPVTFALITGGLGGRADPGLWRLYGRLVKDYGWEAAAHTRWHTRPPRDPDDVLGAFADIEGNITGFRVLAYVYPFGRAGRVDRECMEAYGVPIGMDTIPGQLGLPRDWRSVHYTIRLRRHVPSLLMLRLLMPLAKRIGGVVVIYTHATSYDWDDPSEMIAALDRLLRVIENDDEVWTATIGDLWSYRMLAESVVVRELPNGSYLVDLRGPLDPRVRRIPVTLVFDLGAERVVVFKNGTPLPENPRTRGRPCEGFAIREGRLLVSVIPPAMITVREAKG